MDSSGFSSPRRADCFPAGLRVLVVDDDPTWLKILEKMLKKCNYEVTTCNLAREALNLLRERKDGFDIVISDVNMPDMDGFKLLEHVGLEMDLPVIMMSVDGETSRVMKGVQHGACDYLLKPIRMKELRNIWQHVFRKRIHEVRDIEGHESFEEIQMLRGGIEQSDDDYLYSGDLGLIRKRKDAENRNDDRGCGDSSSLKKARVVWTVDLHQKFVKAVNQIGFEKVGPKKILDLMGVPWLTRENVASHLQKYRLYLSRLQKENELKAVFGGAKHLDASLKDSTCTASLQSSVTQNLTAVQQTSMASESFTGSGHKVVIQNKEPKHCDGNVTGVLSNSRIESKKPIFGDAAVPAISNPSRINFSHHFGPMGADVKPEPKIPVQHSWVAEVPSHQLKQEHKADLHAEHGFGHLPLPLPLHQTQVDSVAASLTCNPGTTKYESDKPPEVTLNPSYGKSTCQGVENVGKDESDSALFSVQSESHLTNCNVVDSMPSFLWNTKNHNLEQNLFDDLRSSDRNLDVGTESKLRNLWDEGFNYYSCQGEFYQVNASIGNMDVFGYNNQELLGDVPPHLYDPLKFDFEYPIDPVEYPVIEQGLFIAGPV